MKTTRRKPTPRLKPGTYTADQVLAWLESIIREEPKRLLMRTWVTYLRGKKISAKPTRHQPPACGTVCCANGWIATGTRREHLQGEPADMLADLGLVHRTDFTGAHQDLINLFYSAKDTPTQVLRRLAQIRLDHADELRAASIRVRA